MLKKIWHVLHPSPPKSIEEVIEIILRNRNITDKHALLNPSLTHVNFTLPNIDTITDRVHQAIQDKQKIVVFGDYDVDGLSATTILWETLHSLGADTIPYIPHREKEGYGLSQTALETVISTHHPKLIITVDCGISATKEVAFAQSQGVEVIITDHHQAPTELPNSLILHDHHVCGAAVAYKLASHLKKDIEDDPTDHLGLAALGTICDIIPLTLENRAIVTHGLQQLRSSTRPGLQALCKVAGIDQSKIETYHLGFVIGPRLNAQGRLHHAMHALRLMCTKDPNRAVQLATELQSTNLDRQELTRELAESATLLAKDFQDDHLLIIGDPSWNPGVIGLIASHLVKEFHKPAIVWGSSDDQPNIYKASARSIQGFNIIENIRKFQNLLLGQGGHPMAAGLSINQENLEQFSQQLRHHAKQTLSQEDLLPKLTIDTPLASPLISTQLSYELQRLSPYGAEYPEPLFQYNSMKILNAKALGKNNQHLKLTLSLDNGIYDGLFWNKADLIPHLSPMINLAAKLETNTYNGTTKPQLNIVDIQPATQ